ncbi:hypothetical protein TNCV_1571831 [Trichonephila clavipes]|uniref:Uncharacterized protein n=1 Tax=Trichonephila clavipes TaxID=2585209 RepID=A0A8X6SU74_TRICX|nr:hypothetical protein TNCV_1571831 [Trichonephila clavipes]
MVSNLVTKNGCQLGHQKWLPTWLYRQIFAKLPMNHHYNVSPSIPCQNCGGGDRWCRHVSSFGEFRRANSYCSVRCSRQRPTAGVLLAPSHDEFHGPRSDYVRQGPKATISFIDHRDQQSKRKRQQNVNLISSPDPQRGKDNN